MSAVPPNPPTAGEPRRGPRVFKTDDPALVVTVTVAEPDPASLPRASAADVADREPRPGLRASAGGMIETGFRWGTLLVSALASAALLAAGLWFHRLVSVGLDRDDWLGLSIRSLLAVATVAAAVLLVREVFGWYRLSRLGRLRRTVDAAIAARDLPGERKAADRIVSLYSGRPELAWSLARVKTHRADVHDPAALLILVERDLVASLDTIARRQITTAAKRVATVTALSPMATLALAFVVFENVRLLRRLATLYGGRPGLSGALKLSRKVIGNLIAAGGLALTDDLLGQFIGQDVLRRLSKRLGEGAFNGALTARIGVAAIAEVRPLPFLEAPPLRVRDIVAEVIRPAAAAPTRP
jgi:putative membrane protein